jgi:hypothetical protein
MAPLALSVARRAEAKAATTLGVAAHGPDLAAHINELEAVPRQLAERFPIAGEDRRHRAVRRIFDFVTIDHIEMSHGFTGRLIDFDIKSKSIQAIGLAI